MKLALTISVILVIAYIGFRWVYDSSVSVLVNQESAKLQMQETDQGYLLSQTLVNASNIRTAATVIFGGLLTLTWLPTILKREKRKNDDRLYSWAILPLLILVLLGSAACQAGHTERIGNNETAFLIPVVGNSADQAQTRSITFYEANRVNAHDVVINKYCSQVGGIAQCDWRDDHVLIRVDRTPVNKQWTADPNTGTAPADQSFRVETKESIGLYVGAVISAQIEEDNAAKYLYYYPAPDGTSSRTLGDVVDTEVRLYVQGQLFDEFKSRTLAQAIDDATVMFSSIFERTKTYFAPRGITINFLNGSEGLVYDDENIQKQINAQFIAGQQLLLAQATATGQAIENSRLISQANAQATATVIAGQAHAQVMAQQAQVLRDNPGLLQYQLAQQWNGQLPVYQGSGGLPFIMMDIGQATATPPPPAATATPPAPEATPTPGQ